jgi:hypothetical protein
MMFPVKLNEQLDVQYIPPPVFVAVFSDIVHLFMRAEE